MIRINVIGAMIRNKPFCTSLAFIKGMQRHGGFEITQVDPSQPCQKYNLNADVTLSFNCIDDWSEVDKCEGLKVVYQPDDMRYPHIQELMKEARKHCDYALTYDDDAAKYCESSLQFKKASRLLLTADDTIYTPSKKSKIKDIDFSFVGHMTHPINHVSRRKVIEILLKAKYNVKYVDSLYNVDTINELYNRSKVVVNHATDIGLPFGYGYGYQCRHFEVGMTKTCFLSNAVVGDNHSLTFYKFYNEESLLNIAAEIVNSKPKQDLAAEMLYHDIKTKHMPEHRAEQLVDFFKMIGI